MKYVTIISDKSGILCYFLIDRSVTLLNILGLVRLIVSKKELNSEMHEYKSITLSYYPLLSLS